MATHDRREQDRTRRRNEILASARRSLRKTAFATHRGPVAQRAEVAKGTIYLYFETKEAILADLVLQALATAAHAIT